MEDKLQQIQALKVNKANVELDKLKQDIVKLNKQIEDLKYQNLTLTNLLNQKPDALNDEAKEQREICDTQLRLLNEQSKIRELTMEECRKVSEYVKTLNSIKKPREEDDKLLKVLTPEQLMDQLKNEKAQ